MVQVSESGCEGGVEAGGEVTEGIVTGSVTVSGSCFEVVTDSDSAEFVPVGTITMGQCFDLLQGGCQIANCNDTPGARCNQEVAACTVFGDPVCLATYTAAEGHNCFDIATAQGATLDALLSINPGLNCDPLSIGQSICTSFGEDSSAGQAVCKGFQI